MNKVIVLLMIIAFCDLKVMYAQDVFVNPANTAIYDFVDELANDGLITINSCIKPYSRKQIYNWLVEAGSGKNLSKRQEAEIRFYLKEYEFESESAKNLYGDSKLNLIHKWSNSTALQLNQLGFFYKDSLFKVSVRPIWGVDYLNNQDYAIKHFRGGAEAYASIGKHWALYASLRDNSENEILSQPTYFTQLEGGNFKVNEGGRIGGDYSEMRGGIVYSWNWGDFALMKDHIQWGDNYNGANILSGRTPSYAMLKLHLKPAKWFDFNYHHGWLVSEVVDSAASYYTSDGLYRSVFRPKFIASNMYTIIPFRGISFSFGNSIIYSDLGGPHPAYMIPFLFFKSVDHTLNHLVENQNSQLFLNVSIRKIKHVHLYGSLYVDEFSKTRIGVDSLHNFLSYKGGIKISNAGIKNLAATAEYTYTYPMTFKHRVQTTTYETNKYNLGHYLGDNSRELYLALSYKPISRLALKMEYCVAEHGNEVDYKLNQGFRVDAIPMLKEISWRSNVFGLHIQYQILNNVFLKAAISKSSVKAYDLDGKTALDYLRRFSPQFYWGDKTIMEMGFSMGI